MANPTLVKLLGYDNFETLSKVSAKNGIYRNPKLRNQIIKELEKKGEIKGLEAEWNKTDGSQSGP